MSDAFESHLDGLFATQAELPDAVQFADRIERELSRSARRLIFAIVLIAVIAAAVSFPALDWLLTRLTNLATGALEHEHGPALSFNACLILAAGMFVAGGAAIMFGRHQAAEL